MNPAASDFAKMLLEKVMAVPSYDQAVEIAFLVAYPAGPEAAFVTEVKLSIDRGLTA